MPIQKTTVIRFLKRIAAAPMGLSRTEIYAINGRCHTKARLDAIRTTEYPKGLRGLVRESQAPGKGNRNPRTCWFVTSKGRRLLEDLKTDPNAMPRAVQGEQTWQPYRNKLFVAQQSLKKRLRKRNQEKYDARIDRPNFHRSDYEQMPDDHLANIHPNSEEFKSLSSLDKIRILRLRSGYTKPTLEDDREKDCE
jgi:hypothetical protein